MGTRSEGKRPRRCGDSVPGRSIRVWETMKPAGCWCRLCAERTLRRVRGLSKACFALTGLSAWVAGRASESPPCQGGIDDAPHVRSRSIEAGIKTTIEPRMTRIRVDQIQARSICRSASICVIRGCLFIVRADNGVSRCHYKPVRKRRLEPANRGKLRTLQVCGRIHADLPSPPNHRNRTRPPDAGPESSWRESPGADIFRSE